MGNTTPLPEETGRLAEKKTNREMDSLVVVVKEGV